MPSARARSREAIAAAERVGHPRLGRRSRQVHGRQPGDITRKVGRPHWKRRPSWPPVPENLRSPAREETHDGISGNGSQTGACGAPRTGARSSTTTTSPRPSSIASLNAAGSFASMDPRCGPSTCLKTSYNSMIGTPLDTAEFPENDPQSFRNAHRGLSEEGRPYPIQRMTMVTRRQAFHGGALEDGRGRCARRPPRAPPLAPPHRTMRKRQAPHGE